MTDFIDLKLSKPILRAITEEGYKTPSPIQAGTIPSLLEGEDVLGIAQTGTGKTAAFALPLLHKLAEAQHKAISKKPLAVILAPTRELANQIGENIQDYARYVPLRTKVVFGGTSIRPQIQALFRGIHILVATPGRLLDIMNQGHCDLSKVETFILDEADRMLDMGFIHDIRKISAAIPKKRQTVLFSATMPASVKGFADGLLRDPVTVEVAPQATTAEKVDQQLMYVDQGDKRALLDHLFKDPAMEKVIIFTRTKHRADRVTRNLIQAGVTAAAIHGNKAQNARQRALKAFANGETRALVATDVAARGIDVDGITHVINFELPNEADSYIHRIGRTARANATGIAIAFCCEEERAYLKDIEKIIRQSIPMVDDHPYHAADVANATSKPVRPVQGGRGGGGGRGGAKGGGGRNSGGKRHTNQRPKAGGQGGKPHAGGGNNASGAENAGGAGKPKKNKWRKKSAGNAGGGKPRSGGRPAGRSGGAGQGGNRNRNSGNS